MTVIDFVATDTLMGYVTDRHGRDFTLTTLDGRIEHAFLTVNTDARVVSNLGEPPRHVGDRIDDLLVPGTPVFVSGPAYPGGSRPLHQAAQLVFMGERADEWGFERTGWWLDQLRELARFYRTGQFGTGAIDFADYRTMLRLDGRKTAHHVQETDTISRLVYGMATTFLLTGEDDYLDVAERGSDYLRDNLRFCDPDEDLVFWYHGLEVAGTRQRKLLASEFDDDHLTIPAYEQIYALAGLVQTYRVTGAPRLRADIDGTIRLFQRYFRDQRLGGYYSHLDPDTLSPHADALGRNRSRKNWNSVGDHAPAYLFNLYLATGDPALLRMLEHTFDMIVSHFPDRARDGSPFVHERFHADWTPDAGWGWQQDRAVVGHNLKIVWNLARMNSLIAKREYRETAERIAGTMPAFGRDSRRGGWYDVVERVAKDGQHQFVWHDRKSWWQQEQAILAYLLLSGTTGDDRYLRHAREAQAFYNAFFLDHDDGAVYFTVQAGGLPFLMGNERLKGSHSMSMYHTAELCYLATVYGNLLVRGEPLDLWFAPDPDADLPGGLLRVAPDALPNGRVRLDRVTIDGEPYPHIDPTAMTVRLPDSRRRLRVQARLVPEPASA